MNKSLSIETIKQTLQGTALVITLFFSGEAKGEEVKGWCCKVLNNLPCDCVPLRTNPSCYAGYGYILKGGPKPPACIRTTQVGADEKSLGSDLEFKTVEFGNTSAPKKKL